MQSHKTLFLIVALGVLPALPGIANAASLEVYVTNLRPTKTVQVSVYRDAQTWSEGREPVATRVVAARDVAQTIHVDGLPPGRYAVRVHQGPNSGGGVFESPSFALERNGSSGNLTRYGVPRFDRAAVDVGADGARSTIHLVTSSQF